MADIELVIKIPGKEFGIDIEDKFQDFFKRLEVEIKRHMIGRTNLVCGAYELETIKMFMQALANSTPLPRKHGRLIDADALVDSLDASDRDIYCKAIIEEDAQTIIPADKESEETEC